MSDFLGRLTEGEKDQFRLSVTTLLTESFLVRSFERHERLYRFTIRNFLLVEEYFALAGWGLKKDETAGVVALTGPSAARINLNLEETLSLLIFRLLYEEKSREVTLHGERTVLQQDFVERYRAMTERTLTKTSLVAVLRRFAVLRLIRTLGEEGDPETQIVLYPSIPFALDALSIDEMHDRIELFRRPAEHGEEDIQVEAED
jgi:hypothetical protein